jgi:hypothetical protein
MIKTRLIESILCVVIALLCSGCLGGSVADIIQNQVDSLQNENDDASIASSETGSGESDAESQETIDEDVAARRAATEVDPADRSPETATEPPMFARNDAEPTVAQSNALDEGNTAQTASDQSATNRRGVSSGGTTQPVIRLRAAVALPQSLPTGTAMGFSVDYQFVGGGPNSHVQYVWVIKPPSGPALESAVQLESRGTLQTFVIPWGPVRGDYQMRIDAVTGSSRKPASRAVSATYQ